MAGSIKKVLGMILAGGEGSRLYPLTQQRAKPAVPFGGKYRLVDFALSNFINSRIYSIYVLTQFKSQSLADICRKAGASVPSCVTTSFSLSRHKNAQAMLVPRHCGCHLSEHQFDWRTIIISAY